MINRLTNTFFLFLFLGICLSLFAHLYHKTQVLSVPDNAAALKHWQEPIQRNLPGNRGVKFKHGRIRFLAEFEVSGRVLGKKYYEDGRYARIAPMDLAIGWKLMSKPIVYKASKMHNHNRFFTWETDLPVPRDEMIKSFANIHIIPSNQDIWSDLVDLKEEDLVTLSGYLVNYDEIKNGRTFMLKTSLVRTDEGFDACEVLYVLDIRTY